MSDRRKSKEFMPPVRSDTESRRERSSGPLMLTHVPWSELESTGRASPGRAMLPGPRELLYSSSRLPQLPGPSLTGLGHPDLRQEFAEKVGRLADFEERRGAPVSPEMRKNLLSTAVNASLRKVGVPPVETDFGIPGGDTQGAMSGSDWRMSLNRSSFGPPAIGSGSPVPNAPTSSREQLSSLADTMYHEARHGEQHFRAARLLAAGGASVEDIAEKTGLPDEIARQAHQTPLPVPRSGRTPEMLEAEQWYHSFHGKNAEQRKETMRDLAESTLGKIEAHSNFVATSLDLSSSPEERLEARRRFRTISDYHDVVHQEYTELPIEKDAWEVGGDVGKRVRNTTPQPPKPKFFGPERPVDPKDPPK